VSVRQPGVKSGTLTANAIKKPRKSHRDAVANPGTLPLRIAFCMTTKSKLPVLAYSHRIAASMKTDAIIVNRKYFTAA
jgi:hypothetical protein